MSARRQSLRELRRNCPHNVTILPTAATRKVEQRYGRAYVEAKNELIESQTVAFPYVAPWTREWERAQESPELRADVPPFDPNNPRHLRCWESIWDFGRRASESDGD